MMKKLLASLIVTFAFSSFGFSQSVTFTGPAIQNAVGLAVGQKAVFLTDTADQGFLGLGAISDGLSLFDSGTYGSGFNFGKELNATLFFGQTIVEVGNVSTSGDIAVDQNWAILVFESSTTTTLAGDTYRLWTAPDWIVPADGSTLNAGSDFAQLIGTTASVTGTVVPEPSSFALLAGCFGLAWVMVRRRS